MGQSPASPTTSRRSGVTNSGGSGSGGGNGGGARGCTKLFVGGINPITTERTLSRYGYMGVCYISVAG